MALNNLGASNFYDTSLIYLWYALLHIIHKEISSFTYKILKYDIIKNQTNHY
jgi:hypothetical protein